MMKPKKIYFLIIKIIIILTIALVSAFFLTRNSASKHADTLINIDNQNNPMRLTSSAFEYNQPIPPLYTCDGESISPPLRIEGVPKNAKSLALIVDDPDAPGRTFVHWAVWNIPRETPAFEMNTVPQMAVQGRNDFGTNRWGAPCPPSKTHRYFFKLYALDTMLDLHTSSSKSDLEQAMNGHVISRAELIGLYARQ
ncbi:MAG: Phospholipid-binding protein, PBP family [Parcubacteria group bacterium GW2011_GWA2_44_12]|nr:MAG: Phospholipid-binding protein, PBP family [Parcubacteria group bacterium GW2011_GWA2_44_12]